MREVRRWLVLAGVLLTLLMSLPVQAADDKPVAMSDVSKMIEDGKSPQQVLEAMAQRGVSFRVTSAAIKRLEGWGFSEEQIGLVRKIADGEKVDLNPKPDEPKPAGDAKPDNPPAADNAKVDHAVVGYPNPQDFHKVEKARVERAIKAAGLDYQRVEFKRFTLYCSDRRAKALGTMLRDLDAALLKRFPASIANASSPDSAHIVIVDGTSDWARWVDACFDAYEADGIRYQFGPDDPDPRPKMTAGPGYMLPYLTATHADKQPKEENISRLAAFSVGFLMMGQAGGPEQPHGLRTGFGDLTEAMALKTPSVMVTSYVDRDLEGEGGWKGLVAKRFKDKKITDVTDPWAYDTSAMAVEHYAECWSLVSTLAEAPDKFAKAVELVRTKQMIMSKAVNESFGMDDRKLLEAWFRFATN